MVVSIARGRSSPKLEMKEGDLTIGLRSRVYEGQQYHIS